MTNIHLDLVISGRVQGVGYRAFAKRKARFLGLTGFVKNEADGTVQASVEGVKEAAFEFVVWCHKGPFLAQIEKVDVKEGLMEGYASFEVKR